MAEAGLENETKKHADSPRKSIVSHDGATEVVPHFVPSIAVCEPSGGITNDLRRAKLLELVSKLNDRQVNNLVAIADKMLKKRAS
jgi:hypothetical protein